MDVFDLRNGLVDDYADFSRSFTRIHSDDIRSVVEAEYARGRFWPAPLIQLNANFQLGKTVQELAAEGMLHPVASEIFRVGKDPSRGEQGKDLRLFTHQVQALGVAQSGASYVVTTGTGSGKSLTFFIPIVDHILKSRGSDPATRTRTRTRAIVIYPMNALANSQIEELRKFLQGMNPEPVRVRRYTGQESSEERQDLAANPPDILLTNFMMLELIMTRYEPVDRQVMENCAGLRYLVLDELHTYRGRQGADVALLVRRLRQRLRAIGLQCIGTSATMSSSGVEEDKRRVVADVATRLFGTEVSAHHVITETLARATEPSLDLQKIKPKLAAVIAAGLPDPADLAAFRRHPVTVWVELRLGIEYAEGPTKPRRARPKTLDEAAGLLAEDAGISLEASGTYLKRFLLAAYQCKDADRHLFAFKLHQFISGPGKVWTSLEEPGRRLITLEGQVFVPGRKDEGHQLYAAHFCRECGQEYHPVWRNPKEGGRLGPREIDDTTVEDEDTGFGFLAPDPTGELWRGDISDLPDAWIDTTGTEPKVKPSYRKHVPEEIRVTASGQLGSGMRAAFVRGKFRYCLRCGYVHEAYGKDVNRLASLSGEGRSSATTMLALAALRRLFQLPEPAPGAPDPRKLLGFSDNRQDAALQAGHFNDFVFLLMLRSGLLGALQAAPGGVLGEDELPNAVFKALGFHRNDPGTLAEYLERPTLVGLALENARKTVRAILGYRLVYDLRRGWRYNNPNLEQLRLLRIGYAGLDEFVRDAAHFKDAPPVINRLGQEGRRALCEFLFDRMRQGLCIESRFLDSAELERMRTAGHQNLKERWGVAPDEKLVSARYLITTKRPNAQGREYDYLVSGGAKSGLLRKLRQQEFWAPAGLAGDVKAMPENDLARLVHVVLQAGVNHGYTQRTVLDNNGLVGWRLSSAAIQWELLSGRSAADVGDSVNTFFRNLYLNVAALLTSPEHTLYDFEAHEHTAQVASAKRLLLESRFRYTEDDRRRWREANPDGGELQRLPVMFCSPTMELGVDISALNHVYLRNVPPTPANYAQRSGRAGRSGQPALVVTYCAAQSPHDQYFFRDQSGMVHGEVRAPTLDLANRELIVSHLNAVWLACTEIALEASVAPMLDLELPEKPLMAKWRDRFSAPEVASTSRGEVKAVLASLASELSSQRAPWFDGGFGDRAVENAAAEFDRALDRWRSLYDATTRQLKLADAIIQSPGAAKEARDQAKRRYMDAARQRDALLQTGSTLNSDFYTYRYLASQGFLPGYNFPRLPLMAWVPGRGGVPGKDDEGTMITRPRFLALSEFGPRSLIYHEGRMFRVVRALLSVTDEGQAGGSAQLPTTAARICPECGYGHLAENEGGEPPADVCESCGTHLTDVDRINALYRIENVATIPAERITVNDEERQRQGFEMQTTYRFLPDAGGRPHATLSEASDEQGTIARLTYGAAATVWRVNKGWRRRKDRKQLGFYINPLTGWWSKQDAPDEDDGAEADAPASRAPNQRIVPYVEDRRNVLIIRPAAELDESGMATLQMALKRAIEELYQIEEAELIAEPLPSRDARKAILFYEAAEGGAGVLTRLATEAGALAEVAHTSLRLVHFNAPAAGVPWRTEELLALEQKTADGMRVCEAGCYRCLLSYFNQPDHPLIDRNHPGVLALLVRLAAGIVSPTAPMPASGNGIGVSGSNHRAAEWLAEVKQLGLRMPDAIDIEANGGVARADFRYDAARALVFLVDPGPATIAWAKDRDWTLIIFADDRASWPALFAAHGSVFGAQVTPE